MYSRVWLKFVTKKKYGSVMKLRIQDLPLERIEEATELMVKYFLRGEPGRRALGFYRNPEAREEYRVYIDKVFRSSQSVICCLDTEDENPAIMGISSIAVATAADREWAAGKGTPESTKLSNMYYDCVQACDVLNTFNLSSYYSGKSMLVLPEYRGHGMAEKFLTVRRLMCAVHGVPLTAAWMTSVGTQVAADRDGWETVHEIPYDFFAKKYDLTFEDVPPTVKLTVARPHPDYQGVMGA